MPEILAAILEAVGYILDLLGIAQTIQGILGDPAQQTNLLTTETIAGEGTTAVTDPISGTHAIWALLETVQSGGSPSLQTITDLLTGLSPTPLPPSPPVDWPEEMGLGVMAAQVEEPVWGGEWPLIQPFDVAFLDLERNVMGMTGAAGWPSRENPDFALVTYWVAAGWPRVGPNGSGEHDTPPTVLDWSDWNGEETLLTFLTRMDPTHTWTHLGPGGYDTPAICWAKMVGDETGASLWRCLVQESDLPLRSGRLWSALRTQLPPIWPGLDGVTLGDPVALDQGVEVVGPLDGVLLDITAMERLIPFQSMGPYQTYRNLGRFAFYNDAGWQEDWQGVPSLHCQLLPRQMHRAGGLWLAFYTGVTGTATPFTIGSA